MEVAAAGLSFEKLFEPVQAWMLASDRPTSVEL
jgi:hypothetical protein